MKPQMNVALAIAALSITTSPAFAQSEKGNGGRVWVCYKPAIDPVTGKPSLEKPLIDPETLLPVIDTVEFKDYQEANNVNTQWVIDLGTDTPGVDDVPQMLKTAVERLRRIDRWRAKKLEDRLVEISHPAKTKYLKLTAKKPSITLIHDGNYYYSEPVTAMCGDRQGAYNIAANRDMEYKYFFIQDYLDKMSDQDRAGLILHEAIYNLEASGYDHPKVAKATSSDGSRRIVQAISSPLLENFSAKRYYQWLSHHSVYPTVTAQNGSFAAAHFFDDPALENYVFMGTSSDSYTYTQGLLNDRWIPLKTESQPGDLLVFGVAPNESIPQPILSKGSGEYITSFSYTRVVTPWGSVRSNELMYSSVQPGQLTIHAYANDINLNQIESLYGSGQYLPLQLKANVYLPGNSFRYPINYKELARTNPRWNSPTLNPNTLHWNGPLEIGLNPGIYRLKYENEWVELDFQNMRDFDQPHTKVPLQITLHSNGTVRSVEINYSKEGRHDSGMVADGKLLLKTSSGVTKEFIFDHRLPMQISLTNRFHVKRLSLEFDDQGRAIRSDFIDQAFKY